MGTKPKKENTVIEVQKRIKKLEDTLREMENPEMRALFPYDFSSIEYENVVLQFLSKRKISYMRIPIESGSTIETTLITTENQAQLDITERVYRLANKILLKFREFESPKPYAAQIFRVLAPLFDKDVIGYANRISDIITDDKNRDFVRVIFIDSLSLLTEKYNVPKLSEIGDGHKKGYIEALNEFLDDAEELVTYYQRGKPLERRKQELIEKFRRKIGYDNEKPSTLFFGIDYLIDLAMQESDNSIKKLQADFGVLAGIKYYGKGSIKLSILEFWLVKNGKAQKYSLNQRGRASSRVKDFVVKHLVELVRRNHRGVIYVNGEEKIDPKLASQLVPYHDLLNITNASLLYLQKYF